MAGNCQTAYATPRPCLPLALCLHSHTQIPHIHAMSAARRAGVAPPHLRPKPLVAAAGNLAQMRAPCYVSDNRAKISILKTDYKQIIHASVHYPSKPRRRARPTGTRGYPLHEYHPKSGCHTIVPCIAQQPPPSGLWYTGGPVRPLRIAIACALRRCPHRRLYMRAAPQLHTLSSYQSLLAAHAAKLHMQHSLSGFWSTNSTRHERVHLQPVSL